MDDDEHVSQRLLPTSSHVESDVQQPATASLWEIFQQFTVFGWASWPGWTCYGIWQSVRLFRFPICHRLLLILLSLAAEMCPNPDQFEAV